MANNEGQSLPWRLCQMANKNGPTAGQLHPKRPETREALAILQEFSD